MKLEALSCCIPILVAGRAFGDVKRQRAALKYRIYFTPSLQAQAVHSLSVDVHGYYFLLITLFCLH